MPVLAIATQIPSTEIGAGYSRKYTRKRCSRSAANIAAAEVTMMMPMRLLFSRSRRASVKTVFTVHDDIEQHQRRRLALHEPVQRRAAVDSADPEILTGEIIGEELPLCRLVSDQKMWGRRSIASLPASQRRTVTLTNFAAGRRRCPAFHRPTLPCPSPVPRVKERT